MSTIFFLSFKISKCIITGEPKLGVAPKAGAFEVTCEKLLPKTDAEVVAFDVGAPNVAAPTPKLLEPNIEPVVCCCGELKLVEPPKIDPPEAGVDGAAPPKIEPDVGDVAFAKNRK